MKSWTNPPTDGSAKTVDTISLLMGFALLLIILSPIMYLIGKNDQRADSRIECEAAMGFSLETWEVTLEAAVLLDRVEREFGIVCKGGACTKNDPVAP